MKGTIKLCVIVLMAGILAFFPPIAFAQEAGEVTGEEIVTESQAESSEGAEVAVENPDPLSSPLAEAYECCPSDPMPPHGPKGPMNP